MSYVCTEYLCPECGERFDTLEDRDDISTARPHCDSWARRVISAPRLKFALATAVTRGANDPCPPDVMDTSQLADGMSYSDWRRQDDGKRKDEHRAAFGIGAQQYSGAG